MLRSAGPSTSEGLPQPPKPHMSTDTFPHFRHPSSSKTPACGPLHRLAGHACGQLARRREQAGPQRALPNAARLKLLLQRGQLRLLQQQLQTPAKDGDVAAQNHGAGTQWAKGLQDPLRPLHIPIQSIPERAQFLAAPTTRSTPASPCGPLS